VALLLELWVEECFSRPSYSLWRVVSDVDDSLVLCCMYNKPREYGPTAVLLTSPKTSLVRSCDVLSGVPKYWSPYTNHRNSFNW